MTIETKDLLSGVIGNAAYAILALLLKWLAPKLLRHDPRFRPLALLVLGAAWLAMNLGYYWAGVARYDWFLIASSAIFGGFVWTELLQFWRIGIVGADRRTKSGLNYRIALGMCRKSLDFLGVGASKLTSEVDAFRSALVRCHSEHRAIRFLLCDPQHPDLETFAARAGDRAGTYRQRILSSLDVIAALRTEKAVNVEVRFYGEQTMPLFRLMFIDDALCLASHYRFGAGDGSDLPQLHVRRAGVREVEAASIYFAFSAYFQELWRHSRPWDFQRIL